MPSHHDLPNCIAQIADLPCGPNRPLPPTSVNMLAEHERHTGAPLDHASEGTPALLQERRRVLSAAASSGLINVRGEAFAVPARACGAGAQATP